MYRSTESDTFGELKANSVGKTQNKFEENKRPFSDIAQLFLFKMAMKCISIALTHQL